MFRALLSPAGLLPTKSLDSHQIALQRWAHCHGYIWLCFPKKTGIEVTAWIRNKNREVLNHRLLGLSRISSGKPILLLIGRMTRFQSVFWTLSTWPVFLWIPKQSVRCPVYFGGSCLWQCPLKSFTGLFQNIITKSADTTHMLIIIMVP